MMRSLHTDTETQRSHVILLGWEELCTQPGPLYTPPYSRRDFFWPLQVQPVPGFLQNCMFCIEQPH
jgi:hypothetical protein